MCFSYAVVVQWRRRPTILPPPTLPPPPSNTLLLPHALHSPLLPNMRRALAHPLASPALSRMAAALFLPSALLPKPAASHLRSRFASSTPRRVLDLRRMSSSAAPADGSCSSSPCSHYEKPHTGMSSVLTGSCKCGSVSFTAHGPSSFNFTCHCQICRDAVPGSLTTTSVGFKPHQVSMVVVVVVVVVT